MSDLTGFSDQELIEELLDRYSVRGLSSIILKIDQSRRNSAQFSRPDSPISAVSLRSNSSLSGYYAASNSSSVPSVRRSCDTTATVASANSQHFYPHHSPYSPSLVPDSTSYDSKYQPDGYQAYVPAVALPATSAVTQVQPGQQIHATESTGLKDCLPGKPLLFCTFCAEQDVKKTFQRKSDWKDHEKNFHETGQQWQCGVPQCSQIFSRGADFLKHHQRAHRGTPYSGDVKVELPERVAFGCGFKGCKHVSYDWNDRCNHVAKCTFFVEGARWDYSTRIRNLLRQKSIRDEWKKYLDTVCYISGMNRSALRWNPGTSRVLMQKLECNDFGPLQEFFMITLELARGPFPPPVTFLTPRAHDSTHQRPADVENLAAQYNAVDHQNRAFFQPNMYTHYDTETVVPDQHEMPPNFLLPDDTITFVDDESKQDQDQSHFISSDRRVSVTMTDAHDEPSPDLELIGEWIAGPEFVNPGRPSHAIAEPYQQYNSITPPRASTGQRLKKSVKRVKSGLQSKKSQQFHQNASQAPPELPLGTSPAASSTGFRSAGVTRIDPNGNFHFQS